MTLQTYFTSELSKQNPSKRSAVFSGDSYIGGRISKLKFLNLKSADVRNLLGKPYPFCSAGFEIQFNAFEKLWFSAKIFELKILPLYWLESVATTELIPFAKRLSRWAISVDNWALSDGLCAHLARIFEADPKSLLPIYQKWAQNKNPWLRRISMVGLVYYSRLRRSHPPFRLIKSFVTQHFGASEYYVQKAVGWTIREMYNVYPIETTHLLEINLHRIHPDAWFAASEKIPLKLKLKWVRKRRSLRKNSRRK